MFCGPTSFVGFKLFGAKSRWLSWGRGFGERRFGCAGLTASLTAGGRSASFMGSGTAGPRVAEVVQADRVGL